MLEKIQARIAELVKQAEQFAAQHNAVFGALSELRAIEQSLVAGVPAVATIVSDVETALPLVEDAVPAVEAVVEASSAL